MCTAIFVIVVVIIILTISGNKKDKKPANYDQQVNELPNATYQAREMTGGEKALNLWPSDSVLLNCFSFNNGILTIRMKNGKTLSGPIRQFCAKFEVLPKYGLVEAYVSYNGTKVTIRYYDYIFTEQEWDDIFGYLTYCGETRRADKITGKRFDAMDAINGASKAIKIFNKLSNM
jgi:hypothetical protein